MTGLLYKYKSTQRNRGFTMVEFLVSLAVLAIAGLIIVPTIGKQFKTLNRISDGGICEAYLRDSLGKFHKFRMPKADGSAADPGEFMAPGQNFLPTRPANAPIFTVPPELAARFDHFKPGLTQLFEQKPAVVIGSTTADPLQMDHGGLILYTPLLSNTAMGFLGDAYAAVPSVRSGFVDLKTLPNYLQVFPTELSTRETFEGQIKIELYDLSDNTIKTVSDIPGAGDADHFWIRPQNQYKLTTGPLLQPATIWHPNLEGYLEIAEYPNNMPSGYGYLVSLKGVVKTGAGAILSDCAIAEKFSYNTDFHNVLNFITDFRAVNPIVSSGVITDLKDQTLSLSNKSTIAYPIDNAITPIFTNIALDSSLNPVPGQARDRNQCSQDGRHIRGFYLKFRIYNFEKEPGVLPVCIDTSKQWLSKETGGWCTNNNVTGQSAVNIKPSHSLSTGWIPCEQMSFCGEKPDSVVMNANVDTRGKYIEYQYHFDDIIANDNVGPLGNGNGGKNGLWGCEMKYLAAAVDPSGNLMYPPDYNTPTDAQRLAETTPKVMPNVIREINPKVYFKPPPCFTCECKACKKGKGGLLGGFFKFLVLAVLVIATGGSAYLAMAAELTAATASLAVICAAGGLGCGGGSSSGSTVPNTTLGGTYRACRDGTDNGCKCGVKCSQVRPPGPQWTDYTYSGNDDPTKANSLGCKPQLLSLTLDGFPFSMMAAYKGTDASGSTHNADGSTIYSSNNVTSGDEITAEHFYPSAGKFCVATYVCVGNVWKPKQDSFVDPVTNTSSAMKDVTGCFDVRIAHKINWNVKSDGKKPDMLPGAACLEPNINHQPFIDDGSNLASSASLTYECGDATGNDGSLPLTYSSDPKMRIVGTESGSCATPTVIPNIGTKTLATGPIMVDDGSGNMVFQCWNGCIPPANMPESPVNSREQKYYENYNTTDGIALQNTWCTFDPSTFDK